MGLKSAYREKIPAKKEYLADKGPPPSERIELNPDPAADAIESNPAVALAMEASAKADEATERLRRQLADLQRAEGLARQAAFQQRPLNHVEKLEAWRAHGMSPEDYDFLASNPDMVEAHQLTAIAANEAAKRHERGTDAHRQATRRIFNQHLGRMAGVNPEPDEPLELDVPKPPPPPPQPETGAMYSAPVSREVANGSGRREPSPSSIRLTPEMREAARMAGITEIEYARQFVKLPEYKRVRGTEHE
jgi:hypothetical protein